jgi:D-3-phosphoglycerate dehydrogenase
MKSNNKVRILIAEPLDFSNSALRLLNEAGEVVLGLEGELSAAFQQFDVIWLRLAHRVTSRVIGSQPRCRLLAVPTTGLDHLDLAACESCGIRVVSLKGEVAFLRNVRATAELTIGLTLALLRKIPQALEHVRGGGWNRDLFRGQELYQKTVGIVGVGRLGSLVAGYFKAFGATVFGYDIRKDFPHDTAEQVATLDELFSRSDIVSIHVEYNASTHHLIDARLLNCLRPSGVLVNTSRGGVVDEIALLTALREKTLAGAALDVLDGEPAVNGRHPLIQYAAKNDNLLIVPHIGGNTAESFANTEMFLAQRVVDALAR